MVTTSTASQNTAGTIAFSSEAKATESLEKLIKAGFGEDRLNLQRHPVDLKLNARQSGLKEGARGGAIAGSIFGALAGYSISFMVDYLPVSAENNPHPNPLAGIVFGAAIGAVGLGIIGALSGSDAPRAINNEALTDEYVLTIDASPEEIQKALELLNNT